MKFIGENTWCNDGECRVSDKCVPEAETVGLGHYRGECGVKQEQEMGEIIKSEETTNMETKLGVDFPPEASSKALTCVLKNGQVSALTCAPVVTQQAPSGNKGHPRHVTHYKTAHVGLPVIKLHRLDARNFRRVKDITQVGINKDCARALRKELQRFRRNERKRRLRKLGLAGPKCSKPSFKRKQLLSEDFVKSESAENEWPGTHQAMLEAANKATRPATNGSITDVGKKDSPPKKPRLHPLDNTRLQFDSRSSSSTLTDSSRASCTPNTLGPPVLFKPQVGAAHPPLIKMPWLSPAPSLFNHSPYAPPLAAAPLTLTPRDAFTTQVSPSLQPSGPPMIPFSKLHSRVIMAPNSSKVLKPPGRLSGTSTAADPQRVQDTPSAGQPAASSSPAIVSRAGQVVAHPPHPQLVTHPETEFNSSLPRLKTFTPSSVAAKPPPLIPLPVIEKQMDILNNKPNTPHYSVVPISSPITPGETPKEETVSDWPDSCTQVSSTSHDAELRRVPSVAKETDQVVVKKESHDRAGSLLSHGIIKSSNMSYVSTASTSVSRDRQHSSVPNASPKVSSSSVGMTTSPMVFIPATVAFATLGTQMSPHTSNVTSSSLQVKPNLKVSRPVSSVTSSVPQQFYWILTPAEASPFSVDSSHKPPKPSMSSRTYTWSPAVSGPSPPESTVLSPTPVSSSSYLASLLKAGVPLVPVSSTATVATVSPSTSYVSPLSLSNTTVSTKISLPAPIMSTPAIITNPSSLLGHNNVKKYKSSRPGPKSKKLAATGKVKVPPDLGTLAPPPLTAMCGTASSQHQSVLTSGVSSSTLFLDEAALEEDNFRVNDLINTLLGETTAVRQIMAAVTADHNNEANSAAKTPKQSSKKHGKSPEHSARTTKFSPKKHGSKGNSGGQMKLKKDQSSVVASRVVPTSETLGDYASVNVVRIEQESTVGGRDSEEGDGGLPVPSSSGIITNSQDDGSSPSEPPVLPAKVDYVPAISRVKQSGLYFPPLLKKYQTIKTVGKKSGHHTSSSPKKSGSSKSSKQKALCMPPLVRHEKIDATNDKGVDRSSTTSLLALDNSCSGEREVKVSLAESDGWLNNTLPSPSKPSKKKHMTLGGTKGQVKRRHPSVLQRKVCVKLELMTHRHIKKAFLKKHQISLMSGILLRRQLRNWDIKRYLTSQKNFRLPLLPQGSKPSVGSSKEQRRMPKVGPLGSKSASVQQMLLAARTGAEPESWPVTQDASAPSTSAAPRPHKHKSQGTKPPRLTFMGENKEAATSKASSAADQSISDRTSEMISQGIITCSKQPLMVFQNERLTNGQKNFLGKIGLNLAKRVSRNSDLDSLEGSQILMDPGMFGLKAKSHPPPTWSLVLDDQGSKIEASASVKPPPASRGQPTKGTGKGSGHKQGGKGKQRKQAYSVAVSAPQMYTTAALPPGQVYTTTFMAPGQMAGQPQFRILAQVPDGQDANASLASLSERAQAVSGQRRIYVPAVMPTGPPAGIPSAAVVQTPTSSVGARILTVDHAGRVRETLSQGIPAAYSRYSTSAQRPDNWNPSRPSNRGSPPPPLTFMGVGGSSNNMKPPRGMPPPLSFMGSCSEAPTRPDLNFSSSQSSPRPLQAVGWTQALDLSQQASAPRNFGVINHTRHLVPEKRPPNLQYTAQGHIGVDQRPPALTYSVPGQEQGVTDRQPSRSTGVVQGPTNHNQQQFNVSHTIQDQRPPGLPQTTQGQFPINLRPPSLTQTAQVHVTVHQQPSLPRSVHGQIEASQQPTSLPQDIQRPPTISNQLPGWLQNSHRQIEVAQRPLPVSHSGQGCATSNHSSQGQVTVDQRPPSLPCTIQVSSAPSLQTPVSSQTGTPDSRYNRSPAEFGFSVDDPEQQQHHHHHHHHTPRTPEVMAVVEALILQLIDIGLPTSMESITQTVKQLFQARGTLTPFCCKSEAQKWCQEFRSAHRLPGGEETWPEPTNSEARQWLLKLKVDMVKFYGVTPRRVFYMQELNFFLDKQTREIKYHRMFPGKVHCSNEKDTVTVLFILSADGQIGPGMIIFPRMVIPEKLFSSLKNTEGGQEWVLGSSMNGWLYGDCISEFVSDVFVPWLRKRCIHFPVALFASEYISNIPLMRMSESFMSQGIQLVPVPRVMSPIVSPAEWIVTDYFRTNWGRALYEWSRANNSKPLLEENFAPFIISCLTAQATPEKVKSQFNRFGICPFDPQAMFQRLRSRSYY